MGTLNTRISIRSSNTFKNTVTFRHDRAYAVESRVDQGTRTITENSSSSPHLLADGSIYYDSSESVAQLTKCMFLSATQLLQQTRPSLCSSTRTVHGMM